jgi:hypothetical protein
LAVGKTSRNPLGQAIEDEESVSCCYNCAELEADLKIEAGLAFWDFDRSGVLGGVKVRYG